MFHHHRSKKKPETRLVSTRANRSSVPPRGVEQVVRRHLLVFLAREERLRGEFEVEAERGQPLDGRLLLA